VAALNVVIAIWLVLLGVWVVGAMTAKQTVRREAGPSRLGQLALNLTTWILMTNRGPDHTVLNARAVADTIAVHSLGLAIALAGACFTLWARFTIGRNWSGTITVKTDHELMTRGPYAIVRHPIYSGLLLTLLGTAFVVGEYRSFIAVGFAFAGWKWKSLTEERVMTEQFGEVYLDYKRRVKALIPFVL
jgi:protein-S-isoprenylcysteine O-methyltransferase Ste14